MFLYRFVRRRRRRPQTFVHAIISEHIFQISFIFVRIDDPDLPYYIRSISNVTLTLNFQGQVRKLPYLSQTWSDHYKTKSKYIDWTLCRKSDHLAWPWPWPWAYIFTVEYEICSILAKNANCHETKRKHIDWTLCLKFDHPIWPWPWPWPFIFNVKYGICYISAKNGPTGTKRKANISIKTLGLNCERIDICHDLESKV